MSRLILSLLLVSLLLVSLLSSIALGADYTVMELGTVDGFSTRTLPRAINNLGQVVGDAYSGPDAGSPVRAFLYSGGVVQNLGTFGGPSSFGSDINDAGVAVGHSYYPSQGVGMGFTSTGGGLQPIGELAPGGGSLGIAINSQGHIAGNGTVPLVPGPGNDKHAFVKIGDTMTDLGYIGDSLAPTPVWDLNDAGQIAGAYYPTVTYAHGFIYTAGTLQDVGTLGGPISLAKAINNAGVAVGDSQRSDGTFHAFLFDGAIHEIDTLGTSSTAWNINNQGDVVGDVTIGGQKRAFLYRDAAMTDLNMLIDPASGWVLTSAADINDVGQITGHGLFNGEPRAFILTPVPEPSSIALAVFWLALLGVVQSRRRFRQAS